MIFHDRKDAAFQLAGQLKGREFLDPLVLAIPRGGVVTGAILAWELGADFDVVLSRKLRDHDQPEYAIGAIAENGQVYISPHAVFYNGDLNEHLAQERKTQLAVIEQRKQLIRKILPKASISGRSVIVTDDGIATGATMIAALQSLRPQHPHELIVAVPVAPPEQLQEVRRWCNETICLFSTNNFGSVGNFYEDFNPVEDDQMLDILREVALTMSSYAKHSR